MTSTSTRRYEHYKPSGADWLGDIPSSWRIIRAKDLFVERNQRSATGEETLLTVSHITGITPRSEKNVNMFMAETMEGYKLCFTGDLVINTMWAWMGALGTSAYDGICSPSYGVYAPRKDIPYCARYYDYLFRIPNSVVEMTRYSKGIVSSRLRLYSDKFYQIQVPLPDLSTQQAIADYLDARTAQIDRKIELLTQKAEKYRQLKQSLINDTVTRGLDPSAPMKDSGVDWLGMIPDHWDVKRLKELVQIKTGGKDTIDNVPDGEYPFFVRSQTVERIDSYSFDGEAILTAGDGVGVGKVFHHFVGKFDFHQRVYRISHFKGIYGKYLFYFMKENFYKDALRFNAKATVDSLRLPMFRDFPVAFGKYQEQQAISDYLDTKAAHIDQIVEKINETIQKLQELRKALINDVVTGKLRVV